MWKGREREREREKGERREGEGREKERERKVTVNLATFCTLYVQYSEAFHPLTTTPCPLHSSQCTTAPCAT